MLQHKRHQPPLHLLFLPAAAAVEPVLLCLHHRQRSGTPYLVKLGPTLKYLSVAKCRLCTDQAISLLATHCYKLRYLNLRGCHSVTDVGLEDVARCCSRLRSLDVGYCEVTDLGLRVISENCPNLRRLSLHGCDMVTDLGLKNLSFNIRELQYLNIQGVSLVSKEGYLSVKRYCKSCIIEHTNPGLC
jgi:F-box/leucine-rich repeat protein 7